MSKINEIKEKALSALGTIIDKSTDLYETAEEKAKYIAKTTKLKAEIAKDSSAVKKLYSDLGSLYYCLNKDNPDEKLAQLCEEIKSILDNIEVKERELETLITEAKAKDITVDITENDTIAENDVDSPESKSEDE